MSPLPQFYLLPSSPSFTCLDRFSLSPSPPSSPSPLGYPDPSAPVPFWPILTSLLTSPITSAPSLISTLETIALTLTGTTAPATNHDLLHHTLDQNPSFFPAIWPAIATLALEMPTLFPSGSLPVLGRDNTHREISLSRRQAACLVVHQFLRTLRAPAWRGDGAHDFGIWYGREQRQESAAGAYLGAVMGYFGGVVAGLGLGGGLEKGEEEGGEGDKGEWRVVYTLHSGGESLPNDGEGCPLAAVEVLVVEEYDLLPGSLGIPGGAMVVSANKDVGFGQSATQEEIHVGTSPEACPAVLVTPTLEDDQVLVIQGAQAMVNLVGQRRDIRVEPMKTPDGGVQSWRERRMLFMDALELDLVERGSEGDSDGEHTLPDLRPGNVDREIRKAYTAFSLGGFTEVRTGLWGCGAFCGDPVVKFLILWYAASLARVSLAVVCDKQSQAVASGLKEFILSISGHPSFRDAGGIKTLLGRAATFCIFPQTISWFKQALESNSGKRFDIYLGT